MEPYTLLPVIFGMIASLAGNLASGKYDLPDAAAPEDPFQNGDLTRSVGKVVQRVLQEVGAGLPDGEEKEALAAIAGVAVERWREIEEDRRRAGRSVLTEQELIPVFSAATGDLGATGALTVAEWEEYVRSLLTENPALRDGKFVREIYAPLVPGIAERLHREFAPKLRAVLQNDPVAGAGMFLSLLGEIRATQQQLRASLGRAGAVAEQIRDEQRHRSGEMMTLLARSVEILEWQGLQILRRDEAAQAQHAAAIGALEAHHAQTMRRFDDIQSILTELVSEFQRLRENRPPSERDTYRGDLHPNRLFTGRAEALAQIAEALEVEGCAAISGLGGMGKTQTAIEYAHRSRERYASVLWVRAGNPDNKEESRSVFLASVGELARNLHLREADETDPARIVAGVRCWMNERTDWLLVIDNADDVDVVRDILPSAGRGHVLLTTRAPDVEGIARCIRLSEMEADEGALLLLRRAGLLPKGAFLDAAPEGDRAAAVLLSREMDGLPLALDQAGAYIAAQRITPADYLSRYRAAGKTLRALPARGSSHEHASVRKTFSLAFDAILKDDGSDEDEGDGERELVRLAGKLAAADLLCLCAFLAPDAIPEEIVTAGAPDLGDYLGQAVAEPLIYDEMMGQALRYSLLERDPAARTLSIHRVVQDVLKDEMTEEDRHSWGERAVRAVNRTFPWVEFSNWPLCDRLLPHALVCTDRIVEDSLHFEEAVRLLHETGRYLFDRGQYREVEPLFKQTLEADKRVFGPEHPNTITSLNNLASVYESQGHYTEAEQLFKQALERDKRTLGLKHPNTITSLNNLAGVYESQERYDEAEPLYKQALELCLSVLGSEHPNTLGTMNNLAFLFVRQSHYAESEQLYKRVIEVGERVLGSEHPQTLASLSNLASLFRDQGRSVESESLFKQVIPLVEKTFGQEHPHTARTYENYAMLLDAMDRKEEAAEMDARARAIRIKRGEVSAAGDEG